MKIPTHVPRYIHVPLAALALVACSQTGDVRTGSAVLADWTLDAPGHPLHIRPADVPAPETGNDPEKSIAGNVKVVAPVAGALPDVPDGFSAVVFATGFKQPRTLRTAPNGDIFLSESGTGRVLVFPADATAGGAPATPTVFAENLDRPYGIAFVPAVDPQYVYVAAADKVVRYPYGSGDTKASGPAETIIADIPTKRHWTRDLALSRDGKHMFVSVGSASNLGVAGMPDMTPAQIQAHEATDGRGAAWGEEKDRAVVRVFDLDGKNIRNYATGLRNCSGLAMQPATGNLWCIVNERDHLGPYVTPDFMARIEDGAFYGWPWYHLGGREDPALAGKRPDLKDHVRMPEVLFQAHSSALSAVFYNHDAFPAGYRGDAFVALHGSHSRPQMTGYKVVRVRMQGGQPTGVYEDFMTGFVVANGSVWGRPAGVTVTRDGALLVSDDANGTIFKVTRK
ncbi:PQQ-dependent sugar dehydrogenase [Luteimonas sp. MC1782]|uniref:PQQ-dependent sugar dehydrogenase n=1 Tax=Luteimonas sp. MC1782 TaxID=2760305 RepID=UPI0016000B00|nr:PQQ-dependent sugar dehydrogenase [Luteimonas sp. MC1782]MBB1472570.1 PQQ-dependent sugar dehydrogenase [Luteimonas sp. MC1782]